MAVTETLWTGFADDKLYLTSGYFETTFRSSLDVSAVDNQPQGISWDGTNSPWCGFGAQKMYLQSGKFSATLKDSQATTGYYPSGISNDQTNFTFVASNEIGTEALLKYSGSLESTIKSSVDVAAIDGDANGISYDGTNTPWCGLGNQLYLQSGALTSNTIKSSPSTGATNRPSGVSFDGTHTPMCSDNSDKLIKYSGQFETSTIKTSKDISGIEASVNGIDIDDINGRLNLSVSALYDFIQPGIIPYLR